MYFIAVEDFIPATMEVAYENYLPLKGFSSEPS